MSADLSLLRLVPDTSEATVWATSTLVHRCPHVEEVDVGTVTVSWQCQEMTVELHSLAAYLASWEGQKVSSEEITAQIAADLEQLDGIGDVEASSTWQTAGMSIRITA